LRQGTSAPPPEKSSAWQIWQETKPEEPGAFFASAPWTAGETQAATVPWWQLAAFWKQETSAIPPVRSSPWHVVHSFTSDTAKPVWVESQSAGWVPPPVPGLKLDVVSLLLEHPARNTRARIPQRIERQCRNLFPASIEAVLPLIKTTVIYRCSYTVIQIKFAIYIPVISDPLNPVTI
jgi:hypothetical protein